MLLKENNATTNTGMSTVMCDANNDSEGNREGHLSNLDIKRQFSLWTSSFHIYV